MRPGDDSLSICALHFQIPGQISLRDTGSRAMENQHTLEPTSFSLTDSSPKRLPVGLNRPHLERSVSLDPRIASSTIPPTHTNRTLVLCFDGTGDQFDADNSNIVQLVSLLKKDDRSKQMVYYQVRADNETKPPFILVE